MSNDSQKIIQEIIDLYLAQEHVDGQSAERFRAWFANDLHREEKDAALAKAFDRTVRFDPDPDDKVRSSYRELMGVVAHRRVRDPEPRKRRRPLYRRMGFRIAAVVIPALVVAASALYLRNLRVHDCFELTRLSDVIESVGSGEQKHLMLPDGSQVWLNSNSSVGYCENFMSQRIVYLDGGAYFIVNASRERPFTVKARNLTAVATGTQFDVQDYRDSTTSGIVLTEGLLDVSCGKRVYHLDPHMQIRIDNKSEHAVLRDVVEDQLPRWMSQLRFEEIPLEHALHVISKYFGVTIDMSGEALPDGKFTAVFEQDPSLDKVLFTLQNTTPQFNYEIDGNTVRITKK